MIADPRAACNNHDMNCSRFYCPEGFFSAARLALPETIARHAVKVLRLQTGDELILFDGRGQECRACIVEINRREVWVSVAEPTQVSRESPLKITLIQCLQAADKMDFTLQKAVELGVSAIQPIAGVRSVVRLDGERAAKRVQHWQGVVNAACEQSGRNHVPTVAPVLSLPNYLATLAAETNALKLMFAPASTVKLATVKPAGEIFMLVGPEGGLDPREMQAAELAGFQSVVLGPRILRTETAGLAALAAMQTLWGDFA